MSLSKMERQLVFTDIPVKPVVKFFLKHLQLFWQQVELENHLKLQVIHGKAPETVTLLLFARVEN